MFIFICMHVKSLQSRPALCDPMDYSLPGSSVHGVLQVRILEWVAMHSSRGSSQPRDWTLGLLWLLNCRRILYCWATAVLYLSKNNIFFHNVVFSNLTCCTAVLPLRDAYVFYIHYHMIKQSKGRQRRLNKYYCSVSLSVY